MGLGVGDTVMLSSDSKWYNYGAANPVDTPGTIVAIPSGVHTSDALAVIVKWGNGTTNAYRLHDLVRVSHPRFEDSQVI